LSVVSPSDERDGFVTKRGKVTLERDFIGLETCAVANGS